MFVTGEGATAHEVPAPERAAPVMFAGAVPVLARVMVTLKTWPLLTVTADGATETAVTLAGTWTVVGGDVVAAAASGAPVPAAVPLALTVNVTVPAPDTTQVKTKSWAVPAAMAVAPGLAGWQAASAVPLAFAAVGPTTTPSATAPPTGAVFTTLAVSVSTRPALTGDGGWATKATAIPAAARTAVEGDVVAEATSGVPVPAAVPLALAVNVIVPAPDTVQSKA
jgi:hypothetical protein